MELVKLLQWPEVCNNKSISFQAWIVLVPIYKTKIDALKFILKGESTLRWTLSHPVVYFGQTPINSTHTLTVLVDANHLIKGKWKIRIKFGLPHCLNVILCNISYTCHTNWFLIQNQSRCFCNTFGCTSEQFRTRFIFNCQHWIRRKPFANYS